MSSSTTTRSVPEARLLVVDDEPNIRELLSASLRYAGFEVATAADGQQALALAESFRPDLLVLDVMMPGLDGWQVAEQLLESEETREVPIIFLTARAEFRDRAHGLDIGGVDYVTKPFNPLEVAARAVLQLRLEPPPPEGCWPPGKPKGWIPALRPGLRSQLHPGPAPNPRCAGFGRS